MNKLPLASLHNLLQISLSQCCDAVKSSAIVVQSCPETETEWNNAALRKNCSSIPQSCSALDLAYHCVPNHFRNATIEVCAVPRFIVNGL